MVRLNDLPDMLIELITDFPTSESIATLGKASRKYCKVTENSKFKVSIYSPHS